MKNPYIIAAFFYCFLFVSCSCETSQERLEESPGMSEEIGVTLDNPFKLTMDDLKEEKLEVEKQLTEIKNAHVERKGHDYQKFEPEIKKLESKMDSLNQIMDNFSMAGEDQKEKIYDRFKLMKEDIQSGIDEIKGRFDDLKKLDS